MAVGAFIPYQEFLYRVARGEFDFLADTVNAHLLGAGYTPNAATHTVWGDISASEIADAGYSAQTLGSKTITKDGSGRTVFDAADVDFGDNVSLAARYLVLRRVGSGAPDSYLMGYIDLNDGGSGNVSSTNSDFDVGFNAAGIYRITP